MDAVILAGGLGTRLRGVVSDVPKPMAPVSGRPFLAHQMDYWIDQGVTGFVLSVGYRWEVISDEFGPEYRGCSVRYVVEDEPLGTGGGILLAERAGALSDPHLVLNGDTFFRVQLAELLAYHQEHAADLTIALAEVEDSGRYSGVGRDAEGAITDFQLQGASTGRMHINGGVYLVRGEVLAGLPFPAEERVSLEEEIFPRLVAGETRLFGCPSQGAFLDIGIPEDYARAPEFLEG